MSNLRRVCFVLLAILPSLLLPQLISADMDADSNNREQVLADYQEATINSLNRDDFHSNIDLNDFVHYSPRYSVVDEHFANNKQQPLWLANLWTNNQQRIASRYSRSPFASGIVAKEENGFDRNLAGPSSSSNNKRDQLAGMREDKDWFAEADNPLANQDFASKASLWASDILGDLLLTKQKQRAQQQRRFRDSNQLSQQALGALGPLHQEGGTTNEVNANESSIAKNREKRRRCKEDRNLSVKNPSFCDTDAYFGAADYSMRDVWDSAGR